MLDMMGNEANALAVARSLGAATKVDVQEKLTAVSMNGLQFGLQPPVNLVQTLAADKEAADRETPKRLSFVYVNFLTKAMLPLWLTLASVGAKTQISTSFGAASMQKTMVDFGREVMKATTGKPFFRTWNTGRSFVGNGRWLPSRLELGHWWPSSLTSTRSATLRRENHNAKAWRSWVTLWRSSTRRSRESSGQNVPEQETQL